MPLSNAERQRRYRQRHKEKLAPPWIKLPDSHTEANRIVGGAET